MSCTSNCQCCYESSVGVWMGKKKRRFMLSGFNSTDDFIAEIKQKIKDLHGICLDGNIYRTECTHIICETLIRSEKVLCAVAAGKWVLTPEYVVQSHRHGKWLNEEDYEWSETSRCKSLMSKYVKEVPRLNRIQVQKTRKGLFCTWNCAVVLNDTTKKAVFERLLTAGESKIMRLNFPLLERNRNLSKLTHIFCEKENLKDLDLLKERCLHPDFIANYLFRRTETVENDFRTMDYESKNNPLLVGMKTNGKQDPPKSSVRSTSSLARKVNNSRPLRLNPPEGKGVKRKTRSSNLTPLKKSTLIESQPKAVKTGPLDKFVVTQKVKVEISTPLPDCKVVIEDCFIASDDDDVKVIAEVNVSHDDESRKLVEEMLGQKESSVDLFDQLFSNPLNCIEREDNELKVKSEELPAFFTNPLLIMTESEQILEQILWLQSLVSYSRYPTSDVLGLVLWEHIWEGKEDEVVFEASSLLQTVITLHPPASTRMQEYYQRVLCYTKPREHDMNPFNGWQNIQKLIDSSEMDEVENREDDLQLRKNRYHALKFIMRVLEYDLYYIIKKGTNLKEIPLVTRLAWPNNKPNYISNSVNSFIRAVMRQASSIGKNEEFSIVHLSFRLLSFVATCCQSYSTEGNLKLLPLPLKLSKPALDLSYRVANCIEDAKLDGSTLHLLFSLLPTWLTLGVTYARLDYSNCGILTLRNVHSFYLTESSQRRVTCTPVKSQSPMKGNLIPCSSASASPSRLSPKRPINACPININKRNLKGETPLHIACIRGDHMRVRYLLNCPGIDVNVIDNAGWTPLHEAANHGATECVRELLAYKPMKTLESYFKGAQPINRTLNILALGEDDVTPLHDAVANNHAEVASLLLQYGGREQLHMKTTAGLTPLDLVRSDEMRKVLLKPTVKRELFSSLKDNITVPTAVVESCSKFSDNGLKMVLMNNSDHRLVAIYHFVLGCITVNRLFELQHSLKEKNCKLNSHSAKLREKSTVLWPLDECNHLQVIAEHFQKMGRLGSKEIELLSDFLISVMTSHFIS